MPQGGRPTRCLRNHDLTIAGAGSTYHHLYDTTEMTCTVCYALHDPLASWCLVDATRQYSQADAPRDGLAIVRISPSVPRGGVGQLQLRIEGDAVGDLDLAVCSPCKRAVLEQVRVDESHRRFGYGRFWSRPRSRWHRRPCTAGQPRACGTTTSSREPSGPVSTGQAGSGSRTTVPTWNALPGAFRTGDRARFCDTESQLPPGRVDVESCLMDRCGSRTSSAGVVTPRAPLERDGGAGRAAEQPGGAMISVVLTARRSR